MPTKSKEQPTAEKSTTPKKTQTKSTAQKTTRKKAAQKTTVKKTAKQQTDAKQASLQQVSAQSGQQQTMLEIPSEPAAGLSEERLEVQRANPTAANKDLSSSVSSGEITPNPMSSTSHQSGSSVLAAGSDVSFSTDEMVADNIWGANTAIPTLDEATYAAQKAQAEAQRRAIEVASLNLQNINDLHELERQSIDVAISAKANETRTAQLTGAGIDYQTQLEINGEKSQHLAQAAAKHQAATRETGYAEQLIEIKDQNFELEIQQAQNIFAEKAARYRAQLTGQ